MGIFSNIKQALSDLVNPPSVAERIDRHHAKQAEETAKPPTTKELRSDAINQLRDATDPSNPDALHHAQAQAKEIRKGRYDDELHTTQAGKMSELATVRDATDPTNREAMETAAQKGKEILGRENLPNLVAAQRAVNDGGIASKIQRGMNAPPSEPRAQEQQQNRGHQR